MKDLWQLKREFLEYCEIEKGQSLLTISNYERYLNRFLAWLEKETQNSNLKSQNYNSKLKNDSHSEPKQGEESQSSNNVTMKQCNNDEKKVPSKQKVQLYPEDITREIVRLYRLYVNRLYDKNGKELKATTQNHHILALRAFLRYLSMQGIRTISPDEISLAKTGERKVNFLTAEEYQRVLAAPKNSPRDTAILNLLFSTGMRVSELVSLNIEDINFDRGEIAVLGKGKKVRVVFISEDALLSLAEYLQKRGTINIKYQISNIKSTNQNLESHAETEDNNTTMSEEVEPTSDSNKTMERLNSKGEAKYIVPDTSKKLPLFLSSRGNRLNVRGIERLVQTYAKIAGITKNVSPHTLRHTFATDLLIAGADIRSVQSLLGHSNISTTQVYTHVTDQHLREIHKKFHNRNNTDQK